MQDINLLQEMELAQVEFEQNAVVREVESLLHAESTAEYKISARIGAPGKAAAYHHAWIRHLAPQRKFNLESIEMICMRYRLRFLESDLFKGEVPAEAIREVKRIEASTGVQFERFKIIAPAERFELKDSTKDPMLLAELPNGQFYFIYLC